jgi:hypothetical protein
MLHWRGDANLQKMLISPAGPDEPKAKGSGSAPVSWTAHVDAPAASNKGTAAVLLASAAQYSAVRC